MIFSGLISLGSFQGRVIKTAEGEIDHNTALVGKIDSLTQARKICRNKFTDLPRPGNEVCIDKGEVEMSGQWEDMPPDHKTMHTYETWLFNESGSFGIRTDISSVPTEVKKPFSSPSDIGISFFDRSRV